MHAPELLIPLCRRPLAMPRCPIVNPYARSPKKLTLLGNGHTVRENASDSFFLVNGTIDAAIHNTSFEDFRSTQIFDEVRLGAVNAEPLIARCSSAIPCSGGTRSHRLVIYKCKPAAVVYYRINNQTKG